MTASMNVTVLKVGKDKIVTSVRKHSIRREVTKHISIFLFKVVKRFSGLEFPSLRNATYGENLRFREHISRDFSKTNLIQYFKHLKLFRRSKTKFISPRNQLKMLSKVCGIIHLPRFIIIYNRK